MDTALTAAFIGLEQALTAAAPVYRLSPGLTPAELNRLEVQLVPYHLPDEVRELYLWRNGSPEQLSLIPPYCFISLADAMAEYRFQFELSGGSEGWNPLWFPLLSFSGDLLCTILGTESRPTSRIYLSQNQDTELYLMYPSLKAMISASARCFASGAYKFTGEYVEVDDDKARPIQVEYGCQFPDRLEDGITSYSKFFTQKWPADWKAAIGRSEEDYIAQGPTATVADFARKPCDAVIHVKIVGLTGCGSESVLQVEDETGSMVVLCPAKAIGSRETQMGRSYEMRITPHDGTQSAFEAQMDARCDAIAKHLVRSGEI